MHLVQHACLTDPAEPAVHLEVHADVWMQRVKNFGKGFGYHYFFHKGSKLTNFGQGKRRTLRYNREGAIAQRRRGRRLHCYLGCSLEKLLRQG